MRRPTPMALATAARTARALTHGHDAPRPDVAASVRATLGELAFVHPGKVIEVRVPPFAAVQIGAPGQTSAHTRGTPPSVIEMDAATWLTLIGGGLSWTDAVAAHRVAASGIHADISHQLVDVIDAVRRVNDGSTTR